MPPPDAAFRAQAGFDPLLHKAVLAARRIAGLLDVARAEVLRQSHLRHARVVLAPRDQILVSLSPSLNSAVFSVTNGSIFLSLR
ncbi:hypothetical protein XEUV354_22590 [Xanthomonas euvesicatoria]|nr:hypothetical protein BHE83_03335 [Xanthomonas euvesicatoria pv. vesicatoria str. 85-10]KHL61720.1 hypothetical protein XEU66b_09905 [Xanthomonas euvesicatoria]KHL66198.1 hypothetical protein XEU83M_08040 [Xanthomonas euvesicatoria]KLA49584.1 hypothetical protein XEUV685_22360 [Xanthomonas euvesicatoria]KLA50408.1 hypothetical protein XEUV683_19110 [Xanthomonas euvesicatoria]